MHEDARKELPMRLASVPVPFLLFFAAMAGCMLETSEPHEAPAELEAPPPAICLLDVEGVVALKASEYGLAIATGDATGQIVQRLRGTGCDLAGDGALVAATELLDFDDHGTAYVFPAEATGRCVLSTLADTGWSQGDVVSVDASNRMVRLLQGGRGIWEFGVSPDGATMYSSACGPTGIFAVGDETFAPVLTSPPTLWEQYPSVLTAAHTFWSVGVRTCAPGEETTPECGYALVRATRDGTAELGTTLADHGGGMQQATLVRCGSDVCGVFAHAVTRWNAADGEPRTIALDHVRQSRSDQILSASGNDHGVYVLVGDGTTNRVVFVELGAAHAR
jgi:hypothetical protein